MKRLLVVAGEGSGDAMAAPVLAHPGLRNRAFGLGGEALEAAGVELVADLRSFAAMGIGGVFRRAPAVARALAAVISATRTHRPRAALLVGFSEPNAWLLLWLRRRGIRVMWLSPPQTWAWRPERTARIAAGSDRLAVLLPFEKRFWERAGAAVDYVGHPALDLPFCAAMPWSRRSTTTIALLPGSRAHEVRTHLPLMLDAVRALGRARAVRSSVIRAAALDRATTEDLERRARDAGAEVTSAPVATALAEATLAICASGTATLECAAMGVPPVIVYRTDLLTHAVARRMVRVPHIGLPNLLLERRTFPELVQRAATPDAIATACRDVLDSLESRRDACRTLRRKLSVGLDERACHERVAASLLPWLE